ncbi:TPA: DNA cytosine methyltransferase [Listeria monocytogenes]|uniref:DNA cytosine methyltransferase n=1 Tax=Listeria monocytogenes TaxID=1639 RepID=UPI0001B426DA|nr:DNA cytosine methyltransferase [Listeria monocytogenes]EFD91367.1 site-specific DNA-methyltransferase BsuRI [Listeria monocytogenes FSL J2-071]CBY62322.1 methyltransferase [Listeria monocytogenes SLCC2376]ALQ15455.1 restriction endonuclease [Listeria monocytogenes]ALQ19656.1 restriction endonuclease [Listeria monocytogenes]EAC2869789.1 DNA cytosine methyltransferase [Listeria monocytogenes]
MKNMITESKFTSSSKLSTQEIKKVLFSKIEDENKKIKNLSVPEIDYSNINYDNKKVNVVSLFSGAGGLDLGLELAGVYAKKEQKEQPLELLNNYPRYKEIRKESLFNIIYSNDMFKEANETYLANFQSNILKQELDIRKIPNFPKCELMIGGFPCPGFSAAGPRLIDDERNFLYIHFIRALMQSQPDFFVAENVKGLMTLAKGEVFNQVVQDFSSAGYKVKAFLVNSRDYGVPQLRERVFLIGTHETKQPNFEYILPPPTNGTKKGLLPFVTLRDSIFDLLDKPGDFYEGSFSSMYLSRNRKKTWEEQSFTIQASGRQAPLHPSGKPMEKLDKDIWKLVGNTNRRLSVKEIARIQTFPDWFEFSTGGNVKASKNHRLNQQYKQIGNAVPVKLAFEMLLPIAKYMNEQKN